MGHSHHHHTTTSHSENNIRIAFFLNLSFAIIEVFGGLWTNSIAILSDALHDLGDSLVLGLSWYFAKVAEKEKDLAFSYGYKRFTVLGALISSVVLVIGSLFIIVEAIPRFLNPINPQTEGMMILAVGGIIINGAAAYRLSKKQNLNEKAVYLHALEDVLGWAVTLVGAIIMHFISAPIIDPLLSILIACYILYHVITNLKESFYIFMQGTPPKVDMEKVHRTMLAVPHVKGFNNCHVWSLDGEDHVFSIHLVVDPNETMNNLRALKREAKEKLRLLGIHHVTIEFETVNET